MLLEYTLDTKDADLENKKAIELRARFAGRRIKSALDNKTLDVNDLVLFKDANRHERLQHHHEVFEIVSANVSDRITMGRAEQQLQIQGSLRSLDRDVSRASRLGKARVDTLTDLEHRINKLRYILKKPGYSETTDQVVDGELRASNNTVIDKHFTTCSRCGRRIIIKLFEAHSTACTKISIAGGRDTKPPIYDINVHPTITFGTFPPQKPRHCQLVDKGCNFLEFSWEPPIIDGGLPITEYEIRYKVVHRNFDVVEKLWHRRVEEMPIVQTSWWAASRPVCHTGYRLTGLEADKEHIEMQVRCANLKGFSDWANLLPEESNCDTVFTEPPKPTTCPLFLILERVTTSCAYISWQPPLYDGGKPVTDYLISYITAKKEKAVKGGIRIVERFHTVSVGSNATSFVVRNLPSSCGVKALMVRAITSPDVQCPDSKALQDFETREASKHRQILEKIATTEVLKDEFIDTDFETGVLQRLDRKMFLRRLHKRLQLVAPDPEEEEERRIWAEIKAEKARREREEAMEGMLPPDLSDSEEDEKTLDGPSKEARRLARTKRGKALFIDPDRFIFLPKIREKHYKHKIMKLERQIVDLKKELVFVDSERSRLTVLMQATQKKQMLLQLEKDRLKNFTGNSITSSVLHGTNMRYDVVTFTKDVQDAWEGCLGTIAESKRNLIAGESKKKVVRQQLEDKTNLLQTQMAAFSLFTREQGKAKKLIDRIKGGNNGQILKRTFDAIRNVMIQQREARFKVVSLVAGKEKCLLAAAFSKWNLGFFASDSSNPDGFLGLGSMMLQKAREDREDVQGALRDIIADTAAIHRDLEVAKLNHKQRTKIAKSAYFPGMEEAFDMKKLHLRGMKFFFQADALTAQNKFADAFRLYDAQIMSLRSEKEKDVKLLAVCYGRLGKLFLKEERFDRAIVEFDRQMSLAREIGDDVEEAEAFAGIGFGYLGNCDYLEAIRYLETAQVRQESLGRLHRSSETMKALRECFRRTQRPDLVAIYDARIATIDLDLTNKIGFIKEKFETLTDTLVNNSAEEERTVHIERATFKTVELRKFVRAKHAELEARKKELAGQKEEVLKKLALLDAIQKELLAALATEADKMISYLVHDQPQEVEVEELKSRLKARKEIEIMNQKTEVTKQAALETMTKNIMHEIEEAEEDLELENGQLMTAIKANRPFRCMAFNPANAAGNEVTGTATGGVENFVCAESCNIHLVDLHVGTLLHVWAGDEESRLSEDEKVGHTAVVTCLAYDGFRCYSGSADETIMVWDTTSWARLLVLRGHEGSIVTMAIDGPLLLSGSADATVRLWDKLSGQFLKVITGHSHSVLSMEVGPTWMVTASADEEVRVWSIRKRSGRSYAFDTKMRLIGHEAAVTCVRYGKLEVVSGDNLGRIFIWWLESGEILRKCDVHKGPVKCMQFDATRIVSGGADHIVCITDIGSGQVLQSLRGHGGPIIVLAFDTERILSASSDNDIKYWTWGKSTGPKDKFHVLDKGQTLVEVAKIYKMPVANIIAWNGITDVRNCYAGMRLIVSKGDPNKLTAAEEAAVEMERKREQVARMAKKKMLEIGTGEKFKKYDRVGRTANDPNTFSLGNRMFKDAKAATDILPDQVDTDTDFYSLGSRLLARTNPVLSDASGTGQPVLVTGDNEEDWGAIADSLGLAMIEMFVEYQAYEIAKAEKNQVTNTRTFGGRIAKFMQGDPVVNKFESNYRERTPTPRSPGSRGRSPSNRPGSSLAADSHQTGWDDSSLATGATSASQKSSKKRLRIVEPPEIYTHEPVATVDDAENTAVDRESVQREEREAVAPTNS